MSSSFSITVELAVPAYRLWSALKDFPTIFPHLAPETGDTMNVIEGNAGEVGSVVLITLANANGAYAKEKILSIDEESMAVTSTEIEGGHLMLGFSKWQSTTKLFPLEDGRVKMEIFLEYEGDGGPVCDMAVEQAKEAYVVTFKAVEAILRATDLFALRSS